MVKEFDWERQFNKEKTLDLFGNIDLLEVMRRKKRKEAMKKNFLPTLLSVDEDRTERG